VSETIALVSGDVHRLGDHVNTDAILPGRYLAIRDPAELGAHCLEDLDPDFRERVRLGDILVGGRNFGTGSSREQAVIALKAVGIRAIVVASAARIFFRNAINLGLPVMICPDAAAALQAGQTATVSVADSFIRQGGTTWTAQPLEGEVSAILSCGGLMARTRQILSQSLAPNNIESRWLVPR
jgi:3-isopropylmalate/(R)-2-methylmalate dehydratase small subunit